MHVVINWLESIFAAIPLDLLELWGRISYLLGFVLMLCAYGSLARMRQSWNGKALAGALITFVSIFIGGYLGSFIVLVPGAQTFESLKDLCVFLCVVLFGYPALLAVPFAYGLSDLIEGVPPGFLLDWLPGYFINPACFWLAHLLIGRDPDFRRGRVWARYVLFVALFMAIEPQLWGHITSDQFTPALAYRNVTPALIFTTAFTWLLAPFAMLVALPLARRYRMFWANWVDTPGVPLRMLLAAPVIVLMLATISITVWLALGSAESAAGKMASRLHEEISANIREQLDDYLIEQRKTGRPLQLDGVGALLHALPVALHGEAFIIGLDGRLLATSSGATTVAATAVSELRRGTGPLASLTKARQYSFDVITAKPLTRETWMSQATPYRSPDGSSDWILITVMPEAYYLEGVRTGNSQSALVLAWALVGAMVAAIWLSALVTGPVRAIARASHAIAAGDLGQRVPEGRVHELGALASAFNHMAVQLQRMEARYLALSGNLEKQVDERTRELQVALGRAEAASQAKSAFLSNMSHELRTPLNAVIGFSELMAGQRDTTEPQRRKLGMISRAGHHLLTLINDILDLSKIEVGRSELHPDPVDLPELFATVLDMVRLRAQQTGVALLLESDQAPRYVLADGAKLRQVLLNLLTNAVKFTARGNVTLSVRGEPAGARHMLLHFSVADTGPGIAEDDQERIFHPFIQGPGAGAHSGTGLGLAIVREYVRLMGGDVRLTSALGAGSTFTFSIALPLADEVPSRSVERVASLPAHERGKTVLVADDNAESRTLLRGLLEPLGFVVYEAVDGNEGALRVLSLQPELVLADWRMPGRDGVSLTRHIRSQRGIRQPRIIIQSASAFDSDRREALSAGADAFIRKPLEQEQLFATIERQLGLHFLREVHSAPPAALASPADDGAADAPAPAAGATVSRTPAGTGPAASVTSANGAALRAGPTHSPTAADLSSLDAALRAELREAIAMLNGVRIDSLLQQMESMAPALAADIRHMLVRAEHQQLWQLLGQR